MSDEKKTITKHFLILYIGVLLFIFFSSGPFFYGRFFNPKLFNFFFLIIALTFAIVFGYLGMILETFRLDGSRWKTVLSMLLIVSIFSVVPIVTTNGSLWELKNFDFWEFQTALVEEIVFRSIFLGLALRIARVELRENRIKGFPFIVDAVNWKKMYFTVIFVSVFFSIFHFWSIVEAIYAGDIFRVFFSRFYIGVLFGLFYVWSGQKVYSPIILHYVNNFYTPP